nr:formin-like protein 5 [Aegilops tauschii subsp. strangulata]
MGDEHRCLPPPPRYFTRPHTSPVRGHAPVLSPPGSSARPPHQPSLPRPAPTAPALPAGASPAAAARLTAALPSMRPRAILAGLTHRAQPWPPTLCRCAMPLPAAAIPLPPPLAAGADMCRACPAPVRLCAR